MSYHEEESIYDEWGYHASKYVTVDFLLPTGIYIPLDVERNSTIAKIKNQLWVEAIHFPLFGKLTIQTSYVFTYVTGLGIEEEIVDETKRLSEIELLHDLPMLKLVKAQGNIVEKQISQEINSMAGLNVTAESIQNDPEVEAFRAEYLQLASTANIDRSHLSWKELLVHHYPPTLQSYMNENTYGLRDFGLVQIKYEGVNQTCTIKVHPRWKPDQLTSEALDTWLSKGFKPPSKNPDDYVLKAKGKEYIVGNRYLYEFQAIRASLVFRRKGGENSTPKPPLITLLHVASVVPTLSISNVKPPTFKPPVVAPNPGGERSVWDITNQYFNIRIKAAGNLPARQKLVVHIGLYHGALPLCNSRLTNLDAKEAPGTPGTTSYSWDENISFDIRICDIPRTARLCIAFCKVQNSRRRKIIDASRWVNMNVFDHLGVLKTGIFRLYCWPWPDSLDVASLNCAGVVETNPREDDAPFIDLHLQEYNFAVKFPSFAEVLQKAATIVSREAQSPLTQGASNSHLKQLKDIISRPLGSEMFEDDKELLWFLRMDVKDKFPQALPIFLNNAVKWNSHQSVVETQALLEAWPRVPPDEAIALLDPQFADDRVRSYAVKCLEELSDEKMQQYLLQFTQVVKYEPYHDSKLVRFILKRSWRNRKIGHFLFWHFKSELGNGQVARRFSLVLEAYLYGNIPHMKVLHKQNEALAKMKVINERMKTCSSLNEETKSILRKMVIDYQEQLKDFESTLDPSVHLVEAMSDKCKVMNSKMRPLWLTFKNEEHDDGKVSIIYKNGDDLRQDMLTLQIISIMDMLWRSEGLDFRMLPYGCLPTGDKMGLIEVVMNADTIAKIQKMKKSAVLSAFKFNQSALLDWIKQNNQTPQELDEAIENFTYSCAGYCVATYVIGVGDRHSDNIMVTEKGQLFHIDFGHILGNFKVKLGINRERVPFVLAHDFVYVINRGERDTSARFNIFKKLCDKAFLSLRKKGNLFITLFQLMLSAGLPELNHPENLDYLRDTLALNVSESDALKKFQGKFNTALKNSWSTSVNWFFHNVHRN